MLQIAQNIKWLRLLSGLRQEDFAEKIGCKAGALRTYENGRTVPNELIQHNLCELYGITIDELNNQDLKKKDIQVVNPDTKQVEYILTNTTNSNGTAEKEVEELKLEIAKLQGQLQEAKELIVTLLEKR